MTFLPQLAKMFLPLWDPNVRGDLYRSPVRPLIQFLIPADGYIFVSYPNTSHLFT